MSAIEWTAAQKADYLLRNVAWTLDRESTADGEVILRCREIPDATGAGNTDEEIEKDFWESLRASLEAYIHFGDRPPLPAGAALPWERPRSAPTPVRMTVVVSAKKAAAVKQEPRRTSFGGKVNESDPGRTLATA